MEPDLSPEDQALVAELVDEDMPDPHVPYRIQRVGKYLVAYHRTEKEDVVLCHDGEGWGYREADELPRMADPEAPLRHWWRYVRLLVWKHKRDVPELPGEEDRAAWLAGESAYERAKTLVGKQALGPVGNGSPSGGSLLRSAASKG